MLRQGALDSTRARASHRADYQLTGSSSNMLNHGALKFAQSLLTRGKRKL
jgi:hypothetical protein